MPSSKLQEAALDAWAAGKEFGKEGDPAWIAGTTVYSYATPIVVVSQDEPGTVYFNATYYTNTTSRLQRVFVPWLRHNCDKLVIIIDEPRANGSWRLQYGKVSEVIRHV